MSTAEIIVTLIFTGILFLPFFSIASEFIDQIKNQFQEHEETRNGITYHYKDPSDKL